MNNESPIVEDNGRVRNLSGIYKIIIICLTVAALFLVINQVFNLKFFVGYTIIETRYLYLMISIFLSMSFLIYPFRKKGKASRNQVPIYDVVLALLTFCISIYFFIQGMNILTLAWEYNAPPLATALSLTLWILILESLRRCSGLILLFVVTFFSLYPVFASSMPLWFSGQSFSFLDTAKFHLLGTQSVLGLTLNVFSREIIGFIIFGVALQATGGGKFFMDLALALVGKTRGGPAKVSVVASGFFGSISGSVISNIITTGSMTIPAMKGSGIKSKTAAAIEACASTGGVLAPPVMGATAFIIASFLQVPYIDVAIAATVPAFLYYFSLLIQVDFYAANRSLKSGYKERIESFMTILRNGWIYLAAIVILVYFLAYMRVEAWAPFYATAFLLVTTGIMKSKRMSKKEWLDFAYNCGVTLIELFVILASIGMIIGALSMTGMAQAFSRELTALAGDNVYLLLGLGALTSFILGMGMTVSAAYIFLAVVLIPAVVALDINPMAAHLFVLYWSMLSNITPPVAIGAFTAAGLANSDPMKTGVESMKIGSIIYFIPFFFVLNPGLILQDIEFASFSVLLATSIIGIIFIAGALQGYMYFIGKIRMTLFGGILRFLMTGGGISLMIPGTFTDMVGLIVLVITVSLLMVMKVQNNRLSVEKIEIKG